MNTPRSRPNRWESGRFGVVSDSEAWREIIRAYYNDEMGPAWAAAQEINAGNAGWALDWFRLIEGEGLVREHGQILEVSPYLRLETIPEQVPEPEAVGEVILRACEEVASRLGWTFEVPVLATILPVEADAPWHEARYGYAMDKYPYDKICLPWNATQNEEALWAVAVHEFAHIVTINFTGNRAPHWVEEGVSMSMENRPPVFPTAWMDSLEIERSFQVDRREPNTMRRVVDAYRQSHLLLQFLLEQKGEDGLRAFLHAFTNNGLWTEIKINVFGEPSVREAVPEVYGITVEELFEQARPNSVPFA